jgi:hypothetical protein
MPLNHIADRYLQAFDKQEEFDGGIAFRKALMQSNLDYSVESLERVDYLLNQMRTRLHPSPDEFFDPQPNQNFLYLLAFYVGAVVSRATNSSITWLGYDEMLQRIPDNEPFFPRCFATSLSCIFSGGTKGGFFVPLSSITEVLFEEQPGKSVAFTARTFI